MPPSLPMTRWALAPPFHPYRSECQASRHGGALVHPTVSGISSQTRKAVCFLLHCLSPDPRNLANPRVGRPVIDRRRALVSPDFPSPRRVNETRERRYGLPKKLVMPAAEKRRERLPDDSASFVRIVHCPLLAVIIGLVEIVVFALFGEIVQISEAA